MTPVTSSRPDVFLSYAREDIAVAQEIVSALTARGLEVALDLTHIAPGEDYPARLDDLLRRAAKLVFVASPSSLVSDACGHERGLARTCAIPILPVLVPDLPGSALPPELRQVNYLRLREGPDRATILDRLADAVGTDLPWERARSEYGRIAVRGPGALLRGRAEVVEAENWLLNRPATATDVAVETRQMIQRSRRRLTGLARFGVAALALVTVALAGLAAMALDRSQQLDRQSGTLLAAEAERLSEELRTDAALLVMLDAADRAGPDNAARIGAAYARVLERAERERRFTIPGDALTFEHGNVLYYQSPSDGGLWRIDPDDGPQRIADWPGRLIAAQRVEPFEGFDLVTVTVTAERLSIAYVDPSTGTRGRMIDIDLPVVEWPTWYEAWIGPDGRGILAARPTEAWISSLYVRSDGDGLGGPEIPVIYWALDLRVEGQRATTTTMEDVPTLWVDATGQSQLRLEQETGAGAMIDGRPATVPPYDDRHGMFANCVARGLNPEPQAMVAQYLARERAINASAPQTDEFLPEFNFDVLGNGGVCLSTPGHVVFSGSYWTSGGGETETQVFDHAAWDRAEAPIASMTTYGNQPEPSLFVAAVDRTTLAIADIDEVVVLRARQFGEDQTRIALAHRVERVVAVAEDRIVAVEARSFDDELPVRRVTVLRLPLLRHAWIAGIEDSEDSEDPAPAWHATCLTTEPEDWDRHRWPTPGQIEVSPGHVATLPEALVLELREVPLGKRAILWPDEPYPCINFTPDGAWYMTSTQAGLAVYRTADGAHLFTLPIGRYTPFALTGTGTEGEALVSLDRRTIERLTRGPDGWTRIPVLHAPRFVSEMFLHPEQDLLFLTMLLGGGMVEVRAWSLADWREVALLGEAYKWASVIVDDDGVVAIPELGALFAPVSPAEGRRRAIAALSPDCLPMQDGDWRASRCWPAELR